MEGNRCIIVSKIYVHFTRIYQGAAKLTQKLKYTCEHIRFGKKTTQVNHCNWTTCARGAELLSPFQLSVCISNFNKISLLFHLFFLNLTCSCSYSYNLILAMVVYVALQGNFVPRVPVIFLTVLRFSSNKPSTNLVKLKSILQAKIFLFEKVPLFYIFVTKMAKYTFVFIWIFWSTPLIQCFH
jgi:hypothetical protein